jgi:hypothetical protein
MLVEGESRGRVLGGLGTLGFSREKIWVQSELPRVLRAGRR